MTRCVVTTDDGVWLVGELVVPEAAGSGSAPAALVLNGSGALDRDSNMPDQVLDIANTLASALGHREVALVDVLRTATSSAAHEPSPRTPSPPWRTC